MRFSVFSLGFIRNLIRFVKREEKNIFVKYEKNPSMTGAKRG
jgi:hypothetical protein